MNKASKYWIPTVLETKASAKGPAGLRPNNLIKPNQKNTTKNAIRANGINDLLKNFINRRSITISFIWLV